MATLTAAPRAASTTTGTSTSTSDTLSDRSCTNSSGSLHESSQSESQTDAKTSTTMETSTSGRDSPPASNPNVTTASPSPSLSSKKKKKKKKKQSSDTGTATAAFVTAAAPPTPPAGTSTSKSGRIRLPDKLMEYLNAQVAPKVLFWQDDGISFSFDINTAQTELLDPFFGGTKLTSFTRSLNRWGFKRVFHALSPKNVLSYEHPSFQRDEPGKVKVRI